MSVLDTNGLEYEQYLIQFLFTRKEIRDVALPHLTSDLFYDFTNKKIINLITKFTDEYKTFPKFNDVRVQLEDPADVEYFKGVVKKSVDEYTDEHLVKQIQTFVRNRLIINAVTKICEVVKDNPTGDVDIEEMKTAQSFYFDTEVGLSVFADADKAYDVIMGKDDFVKTGLQSMDEFLGGGFIKSGLTILVGKTKIGKTLIMNSIASKVAMNKIKTLYITLEVSEDMLYRRAMTNVTNMTFFDLKKKCEEGKISFKEFFDKFKAKIEHYYVIKDYPATSINANKIKHLLKELKNKQHFEPDIVFVDYLTILAPNHNMDKANTNTVLKRISEELHGLAKETKTAFVTAMQFNREGNKSDLNAEITQVGDGFSPMQTADMVVSLLQNDELKSAGKIKFKSELCRYAPQSEDLYLNIEYPKMMVLEDASVINMRGQSASRPIENSSPPETTSNMSGLLD